MSCVSHSSWTSESCQRYMANIARLWPPLLSHRLLAPRSHAYKRSLSTALGNIRFTISHDENLPFTDDSAHPINNIYSFIRMRQLSPFSAITPLFLYFGLPVLLGGKGRRSSRAIDEQWTGYDGQEGKAGLKTQRSLGMSSRATRFVRYSLHHQFASI